MANDTLKLQIEIEKSQAEQAIDDIQEQASSIELEVNTDKAEDNLDKVQDKLDDVGDKAEETGKKIDRGLTRAFGFAAHQLGELLNLAGKLKAEEGESTLDKAFRYAGGALKGAAVGAGIGAGAGAAVGGVGAVPGLVVGALAGAVSGAGKELYKDQIAEAKEYNKEMEKLDKANLKEHDKREKEKEREQQRMAKEQEREARRKEREDERARRQAERDEKRLQREEERQRRQDEREAEKKAREQAKLERDLNKQMVKDFLQDTDDGIAAERTRQGEIKGQMGLLSESQSTVMSSLGKMGLYANTADISNVGNAENYRLQMLDLTRQLVESMNEQLRLTSGKREVQSLWQ